MNTGVTNARVKTSSSVLLGLSYRRGRGRLGIILLYIIVYMSGCKKCYTCSHLSATSICHKNADTIYMLTSTGKMLNDSLVYYRNKGYSCDAIDSHYTAFGLYRNPTCGQENYNHAVIENQDKCVQTK